MSVCVDVFCEKGEQGEEQFSNCVSEGKEETNAKRRPEFLMILTLSPRNYVCILQLFS